MTNAQWWRPLAWAVAGATVGAVIVSSVVMFITVFVVVGDIRETQKSNEAILEYNKDCTQPTGECYQATEARDAAQVGAFNAAVIAAAWCISQDPESRRELTVCVGKILDGKEHK